MKGISSKRTRRTAGTARSLKQNISSAALGNVIYAACQFGMLSALAHFTSTAQVGAYALALAITGPVFTFSYMKLRSVQATDSAEHFSFEIYVAQRVLTTAIASLVVVVLAIFSPDNQLFWTIIFVTLFKAFESVIDIFYGAMQRRGQLQLIARSLIWRGLGGLLLFALACASTHRVDVAVALLAMYTIPQVFTTARRTRSMGVSPRPKFDWHPMLRLTWLALPLAASVTVGAFTLNMPRYLLQSSQGAASLGIFASLAYLLIASGTVINSIAQAASPRLADNFAAGRTMAFRRLVGRLMAISGVLGAMGVAGAILIGEPVLRIAFGTDYAEEADALAVLMCAATFQYASVFLGASVTAVRRFTNQFYSSVAMFVTVTAASIVLVPVSGIMGAAIAILAGQLVSFAVYLAVYIWAVIPTLKSQSEQLPQRDAGISPDQLP